MSERFVLRDEKFGATLFDRKALRHTYLKPQEMEEVLRFGDIEVQSFEHWQADTQFIPSHILYSPIRVYFETTRICNLRCTHCFNASGNAGPGEMTTEQMLNTLEGMRSDNILDVRFTGGEFTQRRDWFVLAQKAKELGFAVSVNTNGVYEDPSVLDKLASLDLEQISVSIDGVEEKHDEIRGQGNFRRSIEALQELRKRGAVLRTNTVLTKKSLSDMEGIIEVVGPFVDEMNFFHMRATGRAKKMLDEAVSYEELYMFNRSAREIVKKYPDINIMYGSQVARENSIGLNELGLQSGGPDGFTRFNLLANGSIWAGGYAPYIDKKLELGNIKEEGYTTLRIWRSSSDLQAFRDFSQKMLERCFTCVELGIRCGGTNVEMELVRLKNPDYGNPYCIY